MSKVIDRWVRENDDQGDYAGFVGFEKEFSNNDDLDELYNNMDIYQQTSLFALVTDLICEERDKAQQTIERQAVAIEYVKTELLMAMYGNQDREPYHRCYECCAVSESGPDKIPHRQDCFVARFLRLAGEGGENENR